MQKACCEKCSNLIDFDSDEVKCRECGAVYGIDSTEINEDEILKIYNFVEFRCMHRTYAESCNNKCLAPEMYCEEHTKDEDFISARNSLTYANDRVRVAGRVLERMEESRKLWLIKKVSGIDG